MKYKRKKQTFVFNLPQGKILKMRLLPWMYNQGSCTWLVSLAVAKSKRQINDWLQRRKNQRTKKLDSNLTGTFGPLVQAIAVRQLRHWMLWLPVGDSLCLRCESSKPDKQFQVWKKWFQRHENKNWIVNQDHKYFLYYK
jgi:hypothetical protein